MARTPITIARTIATAMNIEYGTHIVINTSQFYGGDGKLVRMYVVKDAYHYGGKWSDKELFKTASGVYVCLFMRDMLYSFQGKEVEETNAGYLNVKAKKNGEGSIEYMKGAYLDDKSESGD